MRKANRVESQITAVRKRYGISNNEIAIATVGKVSTWYNRMTNPLSFRHSETERLFNYLHYTKAMKAEFLDAMEELGKGETWKK